MLNNCEQAYQLLQSLGASRRLLLHLQLVGEAAQLLLAAWRELGLECNAQLIELGAAVHDAGKIIHPQELDGPGSLHEPAGLALLLAHGVQPEVAQCCISHAQWQMPDVSFEERCVALADKLWKGKREEALELCVIDAVAKTLGQDRWQVFTRLDTVFEEIAAGAAQRLERSRLG